MVQDVVTGITLVFSDLIDIGELVEIGGQIGYIESIGMRFTVIKNANKAQVYIPNRTITNVINYSKGHINYVMDIKLTGDDNQKERTNSLIDTLVENIEQQAPAVFLEKTEIKKSLKTSTGETYTRILFKIWPGRHTILESSFKQELIKKLQEIDPSYSDWMILNSNEIE